MNIFLTLICCLLTHSLTSSELNEYNFKKELMGCDFRLKIYSSDPSQAQKAAQKAFQRIDQLEKICSDYLSDSELNRLSQTHMQWTPVSSDLWKILAYSQKISQQTHGAFDVTCGPLSIQWRIARYRNKLPEPASIEKALKRCSYKKLELNSDKQTVRLNTAHMKLDLGAIAKGYAADAAMKTLNREGIKHAMIDASGDLLMSAHPTSTWKIFINDKNSSNSASFIRLKQGAVATSGSALQNLKKNDKTYSHIIDPRTGQAITHHQRITMIAPTAMEADALASALSVMKSADSINFSKKNPQNSVMIKTQDSIIKSDNFPLIH
ncbi:FAD:protein FMN transferase [Lentisphaera marina]|uniref:FAD:protein FMN transferase n=1 Tax=Lentisphaera marina TaxID=1111041 RepID=UPI0023671412|nr:FAD:protein FMN transferase [Lentisphaera marina]MDD7986063.1 FAD:protein FMN transferase [Lentisphaera marina]